MSAMANEADAIYVIDDFLRAPEVLRRFGLDAEYPKPPVAETYAGRHSKDVYPIPGLDQQIARITGHAVVPVKHPAVHGRFRLCLADEVGTGGVHIDNSHWTGVLFLTLDEHAQGGTDFFATAKRTHCAHRFTPRTGLRGAAAIAISSGRKSWCRRRTTPRNGSWCDVCR